MEISDVLDAIDRRTTALKKDVMYAQKAWENEQSPESRTEYLMANKALQSLSCLRLEITFKAGMMPKGEE
jgi:hypothetical protein